MLNSFKILNWDFERSGEHNAYLSRKEENTELASLRYSSSEKFAIQGFHEHQS